MRRLHSFGRIFL